VQSSETLTRALRARFDLAGEAYDRGDTVRGDRLTRQAYRKWNKRTGVARRSLLALVAEAKAMCAYMLPPVGGQ